MNPLWNTGLQIQLREESNKKSIRGGRRLRFQASQYLLNTQVLGHFSAMMSKLAERISARPDIDLKIQERTCKMLHSMD